MHPKQLEAVNAAIKALGGLTKVARRYDISVPAVQQWRRNGVPKDRIKQVAVDSGVPWESLSPQAYA